MQTVARCFLGLLDADPIVLGQLLLSGLRHIQRQDTVLKLGGHLFGLHIAHVEAAAHGTGVTFVLSALYGDRPKSEVYAMVQQVAKGFQAETGSLVCRVLLGLDPNVKPTPQAEPRTEGYYKKRPCAELCALAADLLEDYLKNIT